MFLAVFYFYSRHAGVRTSEIKQNKCCKTSYFIILTLNQIVTTTRSEMCNSTASRD